MYKMFRKQPVSTNNMFNTNVSNTKMFQKSGLIGANGAGIHNIPTPNLPLPQNNLNPRPQPHSLLH